MKQALITTILLLAIAATAQAGILSATRDWVFDNAISVILASIFALIAGFFGGTTWGKAILRAKLPINELKDVVLRVHEARRPSSPGGTKITVEEKDAVLKEVEELIQSIITTFGGRK